MSVNEFSRVKVEALESHGDDRMAHEVPRSALPELTFGIADIEDCIRRLQIPPWLSCYFALEEVPACVLQKVGGGGSYPAGSRAGVQLGWAVLPMGFSWSLFFAQAVSQHVAGMSLRQVGLPSEGVDDVGPTTVLGGASEDGQLKHYVYVDNLGCFSTDRATAAKVTRTWETDFGELNLVLHKGEVTSRADVLGVSLDGEKHRAALTTHRREKLRLAIDAVLKGKRVAGWVIEVL